MVVRLTVEHRHAGVRLFPGTVLELPDHEAAVLVEDGTAVPVTDTGAVETRTNF